MELNKKLVHMEKEYPSVSSEFVIEEDLIIPDTKPDIAKILLHRNELIINETRVQDQKILVNGIFRFSILYSPEGEQASLCSLNGEVPFDEQILMDGITTSDSIQVTAEVEDINLRIINSRKCNLHTLIELNAVKSQLYDISLPVLPDDLCDDSYITQTKELEYLELTTLKKDICRIREEVRLPDNFPCIETLLWNSISINDLEIIPTAGALSFSCNLKAFFLYEGEGEDRPIRYYETTIPFMTSLECNGSESGMIPNITYQLSQSQVDVRNNSDGEPRIFSIEQVLDLNIRLYQENQATILNDVYHCKQDCHVARKPESLDILCERNTSRQTIQGSCHVPSTSSSVLQLIYPSCYLSTDTPVIKEHGVEICGSLFIQSLYMRNDDLMPYDSFVTTIPFRHFIEINNLPENATSSVMISLDKVNINPVSNNEAEIKAQVNYEILITASSCEQFIEEVTCKPLDANKMDSLPGIIIYYAKPGDTLWNLAKEYYVSMDSIKQDNELSSDLLSPNQQLLIIR